MNITHRKLNLTDPADFKVGPYLFCNKTKIIYIDDQVYHLKNKVYLLFKYFLENSNRIVSRRELIESLWKGDIFLGERALNQTVCTLRNCFRSDASRTISIETVPKSGYRMVVKADLEFAPHQIVSPTEFMTDLSIVLKVGGSGFACLA